MKKVINISVVIPLYNKEYSIERCINSVLNQTKLPEEIIVIDDGSTDNSYKTVSKILSNSGINYTIKKQENSGVSTARNNGMRISKNRYIALLDGDDSWQNNFIEQMTNLIVDYPDAVLYSSSHSIIRNEEKIRVKMPLPANFRGYIEDFFDVSSRGSIVNSSKVIVKKEDILEIGGFPEGVKVGEDLYTWIILSFNKKFAFENFEGTLIYQNDDNSRFKRINEVPYPIKYFSQNKEYLAEFKSLKKYLWRIYSRQFLYSCSTNNKIEIENRYVYGKEIFPVFARILFSISKLPYFNIILNRLR